MVLELIGKHSSCSEHISYQAFTIWLRIHFSWPRLMQRLPSTINFPKMLRLNCRFENLADIYIIYFLPIFMHFWIKINSCPQPLEYAHTQNLTLYNAHHMFILHLPLHIRLDKKFRMFNGKRSLVVFSRPGQSQGLLYKKPHHSFNN